MGEYPRGTFRFKKLCGSLWKGETLRFADYIKQYTSQEEGENESLEIRIYPGADASFMIYEDEGNNYNYEKGQFSTIELNWNDAKKELEIGKRKGVFPGMKGKRTFNIVLVSPQSGVGISTSSSGVTVSYNGKATKLKIK